jgi:hypothetical protein
MLTNRSAACQKTWEFFETRMFPKGIHAKACGTTEGENLAKERILAARRTPALPKPILPVVAQNEDSVAPTQNNQVGIVEGSHSHDHSEGEEEEDENDLSDEVIIASPQSEPPTEPATKNASNSPASTSDTKGQVSSEANSQSPTRSSLDEENQVPPPLEETVYRPSQQCNLKRGNHLTSAQITSLKLGGPLKSRPVFAALSLIREDGTSYNVRLEPRTEDLFKSEEPSLRQSISWNYDSPDVDFRMGGKIIVAGDSSRWQYQAWVTQWFSNSLPVLSFRTDRPIVIPVFGLSLSKNQDNSLLRLSYGGYDFGDEDQNVNSNYLILKQPVVQSMIEKMSLHPKYSATDCTFVKLALP